MEEPTEVTLEAPAISDEAEPLTGEDTHALDETAPIVEPVESPADILDSEAPMPMPLPTPLEEEPVEPEPSTEPLAFSDQEQESIVGRFGTYARPDGNCVTLIACTVLSGTKAMARLSVEPSPGKPGFEVDAPHAEELYAGSWRLAR